MHRAVRRVPWVLLLVVAAFSAAPAPAPAATSVLRPTGDVFVGDQWSIDGPAAWSVLDDPITEPSVPQTGSDRLSAFSNGTVPAEVAVADHAGTGETVARTQAWVHTTTGSNRTLLVELRAGSTVLASTTVPARRTAAWHRAESTAALTDAEVDDLRVRVTLQGTGASSATTVHAAYVAIHTGDVVPADLAADEPASGDLADQVVLAGAEPGAAAEPSPEQEGGSDRGRVPSAVLVDPGRPIRIGADGRIPLTFGCPPDSPVNCAGAFSITVPVDRAGRSRCASARRARRGRRGAAGRASARRPRREAARRVCASARRRGDGAVRARTAAGRSARVLVVASGTLDLRPGEQRTVRALSRNGRIRALRRQRGRCLVRVTTSIGGRPVTQVTPVTLVPASAGRRA